MPNGKPKGTPSPPTATTPKPKPDEIRQAPGTVVKDRATGGFTPLATLVMRGALAPIIPRQLNIDPNRLPVIVSGLNAKVTVEGTGFQVVRGQ